MMSLNKEQPQFNMSAVFTSHRGPDDQLIGRNVTITPPVPASLTPEIDADVDEVLSMKYVKNAYDDSEDEDEEDDRERNMINSLTVNEGITNNGVDKSFHEGFGMGDPPSSLLPSVSQFGRTVSTPIFGSSQGSSIDFGLGHSIISRPNPSRLAPSTESNAVEGSDSMPFHFGATSASLTTAPGASSNSLNGGVDTMAGLGLFSPSLMPKMEPKQSYPSLGPGFSLTPPASSNDTSPFSSSLMGTTATATTTSTTPSISSSGAVASSTTTIPFQLGSLSSSPTLSSTSTSSPISAGTSSASSSPPQMLLFNHQQLPQTQLQQQPKLQSQPIQPQQQQQQQQQPTHPPTSSHSPHSSQTHFVGTAAVFVPKSMMAPGNEAASSAPGSMQYPMHKDFNSYNHSGMFSGVPNDSHGDVSFSSQTVGGYNLDSSTIPQSSNGNYRTKGCWYFFQTGHCQKGDRCNFSHDRIPGMEIAPPVPSGNVYMQPMPPPYGYGVPPDVSMVGSPRTMTKANPFVVPPAGTQSQAPQPQQVVQPPQQPTSPPNFVAVQQLYRTKPCRFFFEKGTCLKGDRCNFSHDPVYAAAYAANNPNSGFQMPDMSRFTNSTNGSANASNGNNVTNSGSGTVTNTNGLNGTGVRNGGNNGGNRHQPSSSPGSSLLNASSPAASRLSSSSEVDFPPLC